METKNSIRKAMIALRNSIPENKRARKSAKITENLLETEYMKNAKDVLCFAGYQSEVDTMELIHILLTKQKNVFLPRVDGEEMDFYKIHAISDLSKGYKGILEPKMSCMDKFAKNDFSDTVIVVPGCAFSADGARMGYGKGYYDRFLDKHDITNRIALCFTEQLIENVPTDEHDKKVSVIVTEDRVTECREVL